MDRWLSGNYQATLDEKGRIHIPSVIGKTIEDESLMVSQWGDCIVAFPLIHYRELTQQLFELRKDPQKREQVGRVISQFFHGTFKSGKLLIPQPIRDKFKIDKQIQVIGQMDHLQIWNQSLWNEREELIEKTSRDDLSDLGFNY